MKTKIMLLTGILLTASFGSCGKSAPSDADPNSKTQEIPKENEEEKYTILPDYSQLDGIQIDPTFSQTTFSIPPSGGEVSTFCDQPFSFGHEIHIDAQPVDITQWDSPKGIRIAKEALYSIGYLQIPTGRNLAVQYESGRKGEVPDSCVVRLYHRQHQNIIYNTLFSDYFDATRQSLWASGWLSRIENDWFSIERDLDNWFVKVYLQGGVGYDKKGKPIKEVPQSGYYYYQNIPLGKEKGAYKLTLKIAPNTTGKPRSLTVPIPVTFVVDNTIYKYINITVHQQ